MALNWSEIRAALAAPFPITDIDFRPIGEPREYKGQMTAPVGAYVDARAVQDRLDDEIGMENWELQITPAATKDGKVTAAVASLFIHGKCKSDIGDCSGDEASKGSASDSLKRAAVQWGIGRYLYRLPDMYAVVEQRAGKNWRLAKGEADRLRKTLPKP